MKILPSLILSLIFLVLWGCSDSGEPIIKGCMDSTACNYNIDATQDDTVCTYPETNYDCENNCIATADACGTCGGTVENTADCCSVEGQVQDCAGDCGGTAMADCNGDCDGSAANDACGVCEGDGSTCNISYSQIQEIFNSNCIGCHNGSHSSGLDLRTFADVNVGGNNGAVIVANNHASSLLWQYVNSGFMPPGNNPDLSSDEIDLIGQWIDEGALGN